MTIANLSDINAAALIVPDVLIQKVPPSISSIGGAQTNGIAVVGTAAGGPVGVPVVVGTMAQYAAIFGLPQARTFDMGTIVATAILQNATSFTCVRATDGSELAATATVAGVTLTSKNPGSFYNKAQLAIGQGSKAGSLKAVISIPGSQSTTYDNLASGAPFWAALATAAAHDPLMVFSLGTATAPTVPSTTVLAGGTDGASGVSSTQLLGNNTSNARTGMYALAGSGCAQIVLADCTDSGSWATQGAFASSEGAMAVVTNADGSLTTAQAARADSTSVKAVVGDKVYWNDPVNGLRYVSPQGFYAGRRSNLAPNNNTLNKPIAGISGTQRNGKYSNAELQAYFQAGWDVLTYGRLGSSNYSMANGLTSSSDATVNDESYTMMTNALALSLNAGVQQYVGLPNTADLRRKVQSSITAFLTRYVSLNLLSKLDNGKMPFVVTCDGTNNAQADTALGYLKVTVAVTLQGIVRYIVVNLADGATQVTN